MNRKIWMAMATVLALTLTGSTLAQVSLKGIVLVRDFAMNRGDAAAAASLYADDATYTVLFGPGEEPLVLTGKQAIADRLASFVDEGVRYEATVLGVVGETVRASTEWRNTEADEREGIAYLELFEEFVVVDGRIVEHTISVLRGVPLEEP